MMGQDANPWTPEQPLSPFTLEDLSLTVPKPHGPCLFFPPPILTNTEANIYDTIVKEDGSGSPVPTPGAPHLF